MFKEQVQKDISAVFLHSREFAEQIDLDGQEVTAVCEDLEITGDNSREGVSYDGLTLYVKADCLQYEYTPHKSSVINGEQWFVLKSKVEQGLAIIELYREKA